MKYAPNHTVAEAFGKETYLRLDESRTNAIDACRSHIDSQPTCKPIDSTHNSCCKRPLRTRLDDDGACRIETPINGHAYKM